MTKKSVMKADQSASKTEKAVMRDVNDIKGTQVQTAEKEKIHFQKLKKFNKKREENTAKYTRLNKFLLVIFPVFICALAEINQGKYVSSFLKFAVSRPTIIIFDLIITAILFTFLLAVFKKGWIAVLVHSFIYMALSTTELFKYGTNGNHLILSDMKLLRSVKSLTSFAYIKITPRLIIYYIIAIAFIF